MRIVSVWHRLTALLTRRRLDRDLADELAFHLAMREDEYIRAGLTRDEARAAARRQFGNVTHFKEEARDMWMFSSIETFAQDTRYALRTLGRAPGFTAVAVAVLAIGIGGSTAIFSLVDAMQARALPYRNADRLVELWGNVMRARVERRGASYPDFVDWRARAKSFDDIAAFDAQLLTLANSDEPERVSAEFVSAPYFSLLGIAPARGRTFRADEDDVAKPAPVAIISDGLWKRRFGAEPQVLGGVVTLNARPYTIVGVMPSGFKGLTDMADVWVPFASWAPPEMMAERGSRGFAALARLRPGVSLTAAQSEMDGISRQLEQAYPNTNEKRAVEISPLAVELFGELRPALLMLMAAVAFVLLIACGNVANLLLARSEARRREIAVRTALGAGRGRLLRQLITEGCVLTTIGAAIGLLLARAAVGALIGASPVTFPSFVAPGLDLRVASFTVALSVLCGVLVGLAPGLQTRVEALSDALKESARGSDGRRSQRVRNGLVVAEVSLAVVLLVGAGLMIRSVRNLSALNPGFDPTSVLTLHVSIPRAFVPPPSAAPPKPAVGQEPAAPPQPVILGRALLDRIRAVPGVAGAALGSDLPLDGGSSATFYAAEGQPAVTAQNVPRIYVHRVTPDFFSTLRIPFVGGRTFTESELMPASPAIIVSERVVTRFWRGQDPIGKRIKFGSLTSANPWMSIVGVVGEVKYRGLPENPTGDPDVYLPFRDRNAQLAIVVRTSVPPAALVAPIRAAIRSADSSIPIYGVAPMPDLISSQTAQSRFTTWLMGVFAATALVLAVVGIYGVMSYLVTQRTREIGIRLALGGTPSHVRRLIVASGARMIGAGILIGAVAAFALTRLLSSLLYDVGATDAAAAGAIVLLGVVALIACYVPAVRATRVSPLQALRYE